MRCLIEFRLSMCKANVFTAVLSLKPPDSIFRVRILVLISASYLKFCIFLFSSISWKKDYESPLCNYVHLLPCLISTAIGSLTSPRTVYIPTPFEEWACGCCVSQVMPTYYSLSHIISAWAQVDVYLINEAFVLHHKTIEEYPLFSLNDLCTKLIMKLPSLVPGTRYQVYKSHLTIAFLKS